MNDCDATAVEQVTAGIDWLTMTLPRDAEHLAHWQIIGLRHLNTISEQGYELKPRTMLGYDGYSAGNCFVGEREDGVMMQFTGYHADGAFFRVYRADAHISRIDLQVTVRFAVMPSDIARRAYQDADAANRRLPAHRRRKLYIIMGSDGGDTFYLGSPSSDQRGRIYNKEIQSEDPSFIRTWRYELVFRNDFATSISRTIDTRVGDHKIIVLSAVTSWLQYRGIDCSLFAQGAGVLLPIARTLPTDIEAKLKWLRTQVRPTIKLLIERGMQDELSEALGIEALTAGRTQNNEVR
jgi:DNA relaxase NicK